MRNLYQLVVGRDTLLVPPNEKLIVRRQAMIQSRRESQFVVGLARRHRSGGRVQLQRNSLGYLFPGDKPESTVLDEWAAQRDSLFVFEEGRTPTAICAHDPISSNMFAALSLRIRGSKAEKALVVKEVGRREVAAAAIEVIVAVDAIAA